MTNLATSKLLLMPDSIGYPLTVYGSLYHSIDDFILQVRCNLSVQHIPCLQRSIILQLNQGFFLKLDGVYSEKDKEYQFLNLARQDAE